MDSLKGQFLVAMPEMGDERFKDTVIYLVGHGDEGAMGLVVNQSLEDMRFADILEELGIGEKDDIIRLPEDSHVLSARLATQIGQEHVYIETHSYLGPDRRRMEPPGQSHPGRTGKHDYTNLTLLRSPELGVQILRRQTVTRAR